MQKSVISSDKFWKTFNVPVIWIYLYVYKEITIT